ncbi:UNVERIFIED_CONTAM: hypothetical protein K2H54_017773 [Gekko kuhli]
MPAQIFIVTSMAKKRPPFCGGLLRSPATGRSQILGCTESRLQSGSRRTPRTNPPPRCAAVRLQPAPYTLKHCCSCPSTASIPSAWGASHNPGCGQQQEPERSNLGTGGSTTATPWR